MALKQNVYCNHIHLLPPSSSWFLNSSLYFKGKNILNNLFVAEILNNICHSFSALVMNTQYHPEKRHFWASLAAMCDYVTTFSLRRWKWRSWVQFQVMSLKQRAFPPSLSPPFCGWNDDEKAGAAILDWDNLKWMWCPRDRVLTARHSGISQCSWIAYLQTSMRECV